MNDPLVSTDTEAHGWRRIILMLVYFFVVFYLVKIVAALIMLVQIVVVWINGAPNERMREFAANMNRYSFHILQYVTFNTDLKPFPFSDWPDPEY
jgi:hypothetical protein